MGTNYYADWNPPGAENVTVRLHICKSLTMFNGLVFPSWRRWKEFLLYNGGALGDGKWYTGQGRLRIVDEYGDTYSAEGFALRVEATGQEERRRQTQWVIDNDGLRNMVIKYDPDVDWFDPEGFSFHRGEFS